jgi:uncharacterized membrane protein YeaQ/YmgE (transglycosylase-associated protein family)
MLLGILLWIVFGALAGWIASIIMGTDGRQGAMGNIVVGILGAFVGGFLFSLLGGAGFTGFNLPSFIVAIVGAVVLLAIVRALSGRATKSVHHV